MALTIVASHATSTWVDNVRMAVDRLPLDLEVNWIHGSRSRRRTDPPLQVHTLAPGTVVMRQSKDLTFEAPFILLLVGEERALLVDTGATRDRLVREAVDDLLGDLELVVAPSHGHRDHIAGDAAFAGRPATTVVGTDEADVRSYFGVTQWPHEVVSFDLGGRVVQIFAIPGHHRASIAVYDDRTGLLHTGDTVYRAASTSRIPPRFSTHSSGWWSSRRVTRSGTSSAATWR